MNYSRSGLPVPLVPKSNMQSEFIMWGGGAEETEGERERWGWEVINCPLRSQKLAFIDGLTPWCLMTNMCRDLGPNYPGFLPRGALDSSHIAFVSCLMTNMLSWSWSQVPWISPPRSTWFIPYFSQQTFKTVSPTNTSSADSFYHLRWTEKRRSTLYSCQRKMVLGL